MLNEWPTYMIHHIATIGNTIPKKKKTCFYYYILFSIVWIFIIHLIFIFCRFWPLDRRNTKKKQYRIDRGTCVCVRCACAVCVRAPYTIPPAVRDCHSRLIHCSTCHSFMIIVCWFSAFRFQIVDQIFSISTSAGIGCCCFFFTIEHFRSAFRHERLQHF